MSGATTISSNIVTVNNQTNQHTADAVRALAEAITANAAAISANANAIKAIAENLTPRWQGAGINVNVSDA